MTQEQTTGPVPVVEPPTRPQRSARRPGPADLQPGVTRPQARHRAVPPESATPDATGRRYVPPALAARYAIGELIGSGGEASVWLAQPVDEPGRPVALKIYQPGLPFDEALRRRLDDPALHSCVPALYGYGIERTADGIAVGWEAMEYFPLGSLADLVRREAPQTSTLPPARLRAIVASLVDALSFWENAIRQRQTDLSPGNILVRADGARPELVLGDLGGVRSTGHSQRFDVTAKVAYMSPEAMAGVNHPRGPYWSLGVICFQLLTGGLLYGTDLTEQAMKVLLIFEEPDVSGLPGEWQDLAAGLLTKRPEDRWGEAEVRAWLAGYKVPVQRQQPRPVAQAPITFAHRPYRDPESLAAAMVEASDDAARWLAGSGAARLREWLSDDLADKRFDKHLLVGLAGKPGTAHVTVAAFAATYLSELEPRYRGRLVTVAGLRALAADESRHEMLAEIVTVGVLAYAARHRCGHPDCAEPGATPRCRVLEALSDRITGTLALARADLTRLPDALDRDEAAQSAFPREGGSIRLLDPRTEATLCAYATLLSIEPGRSRRLLRPVRWNRRLSWLRGPAKRWWRARRRAALAGRPDTPQGLAAILVAIVLCPYARGYQGARAAVRREAVAGPVRAWARRSTGRVATVLAGQADRAGRLAAAWSIVAALSMVELAGVAPEVSGWTDPEPAVSSGIMQGISVVRERAPAFLTHGMDPLGMWTGALVPAESTWVAVAAVPVLLAIGLAVARRSRGQTRRARAVRVTAALAGRLLMVLYLLHLAPTALAPVAVGAMGVHPAFLAAIVVGTAIAMRIAGGPRPYPVLPRRHGWRLLAAFGCVGLTAWLLQYTPLPSLRPVLDLAGVPDAGHATLVGAGRVFFATSEPGAVTITAIGLPGGQKVWSRRLVPDDLSTANTLQLRNSANVLVVHLSDRAGGGPVYALAIGSGKVLWRRSSGEVYPFQNAMLLVDPGGAGLAALSEVSGTVRWRRSLPAGSTVTWQLRDPEEYLYHQGFDGSRLAVGQVLSVEPGGTVRVLRPTDGTVLAERSALVRSGRSVVAIENRLLWTDNDSGYRLLAYAVNNLSRQAWAYTAPAGARDPSAPAYCGRDRICLADSGGTRSVDARTGQIAWQRPGASEDAFGVPGGYAVIWIRDGSTLLDPNGTVLASFRGERAYPVGGDRLLLLSGMADSGVRDRDLAVYSIASGHRRPLGHLAVSPASCSWTDVYLACSGDRLRLWSLPA